MDFPVANETGLLRERLAAHVAHVNTFAGMQKKMLTKAAVPGESSVADRTTVRFIARMNPHMLPQVVILEEGLAALLAHRLFLPLVLRQHVLIQIRLRDESPMTQRTFVFGLIMRVLLMSIQAVAIAARLAAYVAYHRRFPMIQSRVSGEIALDLEFLTTLLARITVMLRMLAHKMRSQGLLTGAD